MLPDYLAIPVRKARAEESQCTYRCVVLPDKADESLNKVLLTVSMHLQVRGAP